MDKNSKKNDERTMPVAARSRSEGEMRAALEVLSTGIVKPIPPNYDPPINILDDAINELLILRQLRYDVLDFIQKEHALIMRQ